MAFLLVVGRVGSAIASVSTPAFCRSCSTNSAHLSLPSTVENVTLAPAALRCLATTPAPPTKSSWPSKRTDMVGVLVWPPIIAVWV